MTCVLLLSVMVDIAALALYPVFCTVSISNDEKAGEYYHKGKTIHQGWAAKCLHMYLQSAHLSD